jgi:hypothetical protein
MKAVPGVMTLPLKAGSGGMMMAVAALLPTAEAISRRTCSTVRIRGWGGVGCGVGCGGRMWCCVVVVKLCAACAAQGVEALLHRLGREHLPGRGLRVLVTPPALQPPPARPVHGLPSAAHPHNLAITPQ